MVTCLIIGFIGTKHLGRFNSQTSEVLEKGINIFIGHKYSFKYVKVWICKWGQILKPLLKVLRSARFINKINF